MLIVITIMMTMMMIIICECMYIERDYNLFVNGTSRESLDYYDNIEKHIGDKNIQLLNKVNTNKIKIFENGFVYDLN